MGAAREIGTTVVIEDVAFPMRYMADATVELQRLMREHGYAEGIIFGHALDGNLHFVFTQGFDDPKEVLRYQRFMEAVCEMVVRKYDGSLKGEHGTGRNMAPFVEMEWGPKAYGLMKRVKALLDPKGLLNPGVLLNDDPHVYLKNLKPLPRAHEVVDRCIECGFCEVKCPSRELTTTPRQRIAVQREMARLRATGEDPARLARLASDFRYQGEETCATDGLCATACPVGIDTGEMVKDLRSRGRSAFARWVAKGVAGHLPGTAAGLRLALAGASAANAVLGPRLLPGWMPSLPRPQASRHLADVSNGGDRKVVYFPSCIVRTMGPARADPEQRAVFDAMLSVLGKARYDVLFPRPLGGLCCGLPFDSKGFRDLADAKAKELEAALLERSDGGAIPVLCDTSPCLQRMRKAMDGRLRLYEPVEFIHGFLMERLRFARQPGPVAIHVTCSSTKLGLAERFRAVAQACAEKVIVPPRVGCCGFAGDRGFSHPELNASALSELRAGLGDGCQSGYSNSRTCEIGLSVHGGIPYQSIVFLVDRCTSTST